MRLIELSFAKRILLWRSYSCLRAANKIIIEVTISGLKDQVHAYAHAHAMHEAGC